MLVVANPTRTRNISRPYLKERLQIKQKLNPIKDCYTDKDDDIPAMM